MEVLSIRLLRTCALVAASFSFAACAAGTQPRAGVVSTSRMGVVKGPGVVAPGVLQVEAGYLQAERGERIRRVYGETLLRVGLGYETELRATLPSYLRTTTPTASPEGAGDAALVLKHRLRTPAGWRPGLAVTLGTTLPTGAEAVSTGKAQPEAGAAAEWRLRQGVALVAAASHRHAILAGDRFGQNTVGAAARADVGRSVTGQVEYVRILSTRAGAADVDQLRATAALRLTPDLQLDGWAGRATQDGFPGEAQLGFGFTRRW
jgi:hypothetical protein